MGEEPNHTTAKEPGLCLSHSKAVVYIEFHPSLHFRHGATSSQNHSLFSSSSRISHSEKSLLWLTRSFEHKPLLCLAPPSLSTITFQMILSGNLHFDIDCKQRNRNFLNIFLAVPLGVLTWALALRMLLLSVFLNVLVKPKTLVSTRNLRFLTYTKLLKEIKF